MRRRVLVVVLLALLLGPLAAAAGPAQADDRLSVVGFVEDSSPLSVIDRSAAALATVGIDGVSLTEAGSWTTDVSTAARRQVHRAHALHLRAELLIGNFFGDDFNEPVAYRLLADPAHRARVAQRLADLVTDNDFDGLSVDLESLTRRDRAGLTLFLRAVRADLPDHSLAIDVQNNLSRAAYDANGYDLAEIAATVDRVDLMTYDEHGPWENTPGPIGALAWQRRGVGVLLQQVPARMVGLGVAGYGYAWRPHSNDTLTVAQAIRLAGSRARWDATVGEWTATLADGSTLWWSDTRSYRARAQLARDLGLAGLAVWSLGQSQPLPA